MSFDLVKGMRFGEMRALMQKGRWHFKVGCWPDKGRWVLAITEWGNKDAPQHVLIAEKSGIPRRMTPEAALRVAWLLGDSDVIFHKAEYRSSIFMRGSLDGGLDTRRVN